MKQIEKAYEAQQYEENIYREWEKSGLFAGKISPNKKSFSIAMPPPNATGTLHLGHATMLAIEDIMVRFKRMQGYATLWLPGTDHAAIATQNRVEKMIAEQGETRFSLGREKFLQKVEAFVEGSRSTIRNQIRKMGASCDWSRERYTLDKGLTEAVREIFVRMYEDGLIYRGNRIVNWCVRCASTLADDEVVFKEEKTKFYYLKYGPVIIGTARPETKFLDKTIVAHPSDQRYQKYFGKTTEVPWIQGSLTANFIADSSADPEFGTGAMTLTPAHDFIDFEIAQKHRLEVVQIIDEKGNFTAIVGPEFAGKNARASREAIVKILEAKGLVEKIDENYVHNLSVCYRCGTPIEPLVSKQWFIDVNKPILKVGKKMTSLKEQAAEVVRSGKISIIPDRFNKIYFHWLDNLRDWCISRQIWFGHQIPVWYCRSDSPRPGCEKPITQTTAPHHCPHCHSSKIEQDPDTLDTWFSSGLWTFSTLGWPEKTKELKYFHPTSVLETGYDILFFWVARMILMTNYALHTIPFKHVYLHGLVRDRDGKKMSKSAGNGIDPLDMIAKFGTDAVRLSLVIGTSPGNDFRLYEEKIAGYRNFVNKIWNGARFALLNIPENFSQKFTKKSVKTLADQWIVSKLQHLIKEVSGDMENFRFSEAGTKIYDFTWSTYCDWYVEASKGEQLNPAVLLYVLKNLLQLLHPFVPFVTEALWSHLGEKKLLLGESWPKYDRQLIFSTAEKKFEVIKNLITTIRSIRSEQNIDATKKIHAVVYGGKWTSILRENVNIIERMARLEKLQLELKGPKIAQALWKYQDGIDLYLPLKELFDIEVEKKQTLKKLEQNKIRIETLEKKLSNPGFLAKAPAEVVAKEQQVFEDLRQELKALEKKLAEFQGLS